MKAKFSGFITFLFLAFLLLCCSSVSARLLLQIHNHGEKEFKANEMMMILADTKDDFSEASMKPRIQGEAHQLEAPIDRTSGLS
ncbi:uncharacterized protein LOC108466665 isoform X2 [Gossypium arboreum]|uniref:uncharacterized protein LOC108466665 isoform X2 n=1 Tax=Gossypium arboreum TaxID=29729 RepID=UPI0022F1AA4E|nr:uncharacterized protein LOC108466665 isoform X2 [Gossypium arboreum]